MRRTLLLSLSMFLSMVAARAQKSYYTTDDSLCVCRLLADGQHDALWFARQFIGTPYVAHTLELYPDEERLILNTRELDCTTFVDVVVALTLCSQRGEKTFGAFMQQLRAQRYRQGICDCYPSRIHYFTDWIEDNTRLGFVHEIKGSNPPFTAWQTLKIDYMSKHADAYVALKRHPEYLTQIAMQEQSLTARRYRYIPTADVSNTPVMRQTVHDGDILATVSTTPGLDIAHLGFAVWHDDGLYLLDASGIHKRVVEEPIPLRQYLQRRRNMSGVRVVRIKK